MKDTMKRVMMIMVLGALIAYLVPAQAQTFQNPNAQQNRNPQMVQTGARYTGTVYEPFSGSVPSEQSAVGASYAPGRPGSIRRDGYDDDDWGVNPQVGEGDEGSPIGDAVLPLLLMAGAFTGVVYMRRKRRV